MTLYNVILELFRRCGFFLVLLPIFFQQGSCYLIFLFTCIFCRSLFVLLFFFFWSWCCLSFFFWSWCCLSFFFWSWCCLSFFFWSWCCLSFFFWSWCCLSFFFWPLCCLSFFDLRILNTLWYLQTLLKMLSVLDKYYS